MTHANSGKKVRLSNSHKLFGRDRETVDVAYPGDVIGLVGNTQFAIGDTLTEDPDHPLSRNPALPARVLHATCTIRSPSNYKRFRDGLEQLLQEGVVQSFTPAQWLTVPPLLAAVGPLQFEIVKYRLESEYGAAVASSNPPRGRWCAGIVRVTANRPPR